MVNDLKYKIITVLLIIVFIVECIIGFNLRARQASINMLIFDEEYSSYNDSMLLGVYNGEGFYCVVTDGLSQQKINSTVVHEECHLLTDYNFEHFCHS